MDEQRVTFRRDYDPYMGIWKYLAVFPDDPANAGRYAFSGFYFSGDDVAVYEPHGEMSMGYYYKTKCVHKNTEEAAKCLKAIKERYEGQRFKVYDKIMRH